VPKLSGLRINNRKRNNFNSFLLSFRRKVKNSICTLPEIDYLDTITVDKSKYTWHDYNIALRNILKNDYTTASATDGSMRVDINKGNIVINNPPTEYMSYNQKEADVIVALQLVMPRDLSAVALLAKVLLGEELTKISETDLGMGDLFDINTDPLSTHKKLTDLAVSLKNNNTFMEFFKKFIGRVREKAESLSINYGYKANEYKNKIVELLKDPDKLSFNMDSSTNFINIGRRRFRIGPILVYSLLINQGILHLDNQEGSINVIPIQLQLLNRTRMILNTGLLTKSFQVDTNYIVYRPMM
jgi:hypothetical protein